MSATRRAYRRTCPFCLTAFTSRRRWFLHDSFLTSYDHTCHGILSAQRIALLEEQIRVNRQHAEQWGQISAAWRRLGDALDQQQNTASQPPEEGSP